MQSFVWSDSLRLFAINALSHHAEMKGSFCVMLHWFNASCVVWKRVKGRGDVVYRNGCVNRLSEEQNSLGYFLRYLEEAMHSLTAHQFSQITEVVVSIVFHILCSETRFFNRHP